MQNLEIVTLPSYTQKRQTFSSLLFKMQILRDCEYFYPQNGREFHLINHRRWKKHKTDFFNDPECVMQLTKSLLKLDFGLKLELPDDRLCPPVSFVSFLDAFYDLTRP